ncbi:MAG: FtsW/RodA/SpoVE family cell cycle protein [Anaerolineae bacterium]|nr:FtsW/RodA/SpoVE family cell cycle protein [Anaerolineae bacterium]
MTSQSPFTEDIVPHTARTERVLLTIVGLFLLMNFFSLAILQQSTWQPALHFFVWVGCAIVGTSVLDRYLPNRDALLFPIVMFMSGWGVILVDRLAPNFADRQTLWLLLSTAVMLLVASLPQLLRWLRVYRYVILISGIVLLVSTIVLGQNPSGLAGAPQLWLGFGKIFFQPSEALKVILVAFLASYLSEQYPALRAESRLKQFASGQLWMSPRILGPILTMWGLSVVLVVWQRDLGTAALFFAVFLILLYVASGQTFILIGGGLLLVIAGFVAYNLFSVVALRVDIWINPWAEADGRAYQIVQSLMAFGAGGIFGTGIGQGSPTYIPVVHSDFVFSALAEEYGLLGVIVLLACVAIFVMRGLRIAVLHQDRPFYALMAIGLSMLIGIQSFF